jgi:hypothetical protein
MPFRMLARANWGRWVVDCPRCPSALSLAPQSPVFQCADCGTRAEVEWPSQEMVYGIERLLLMRPDVTKQNWQPGETLIDLVAENGAHGILSLPDGYDAHLIVEPERIRVDTLPVTFRRELKAIG